ncbi:hypothetical protein BRC89_03425 [Halobacteriales archaeon QS_4_70_19]|nr:MAG: hypothetical protein BRC89_03425 [Halobacteriales archaeon QS_4_70_19]
MSDGDGLTDDAAPGAEDRDASEPPASDGTDGTSGGNGTDDVWEGDGGDGTATDDGTDRPLDPDAVDVRELTGPERTLEPPVRLVWVLRAALVALVLGTVVGAVSIVLQGPAWLGPAVFTALFVLGATHAHLRYRSWSYHVQADSLFLDRGVLTRVRTVVPYVRIQHVDVSRGPVERGFGLATVVVYTAGSRGADVTIPGLTPGRADELQERLKRLAIAAEGEDAV